MRTKIPGPSRPGDEDLQYLAVRRPLIEWALRRAVAEEPRIAVRSGAKVSGFGVAGRRVTTVEFGGSSVAVDLLVDALGRRTPTTDWIARAGIATERAETSDCGVIYYSRYYRLRDGFDLPDGPWLLGPRGDLGYLGFNTFPGDQRTFAALLAVPAGAPEWHVLKNANAFEAAVAQIPSLAQWVDPESVVAITDVLSMAGLHNTFRPYDPVAVSGLVPIGDTFCHTDPAIAHGLSFALMHAVELTKALRELSQLGDALGAYASSTTPMARERYDFATALDEQRHRMWMGEQVNFASHDGDYALFSTIAAGVASMMDADVFRVFVRRMGLLDSTAVLDTDHQMQQRIESLFQQALKTPRPPTGPDHDDLLAIITAAVAS